MVAIALNEVSHVTLEPFVKVIAVTMGADLALGHFPFVEGLVHHQKAHAVTEIQEFCGIRIVAGANGIATHLPQNFQPPLPNSLRNGGANAAAIVMKANAIQFDALAVSHKSLVPVEHGIPDADGR